MISIEQWRARIGSFNNKRYSGFLSSLFSSSSYYYYHPRKRRNLSREYWPLTAFSTAAKAGLTSVRASSSVLMDSSSAEKHSSNTCISEKASSEPSTTIPATSIPSSTSGIPLSSSSSSSSSSSFFTTATFLFSGLFSMRHSLLREVFVILLIAIISQQLIISGDIETNPGPKHGVDDKPDLSDLQYMSYTGDDERDVHFRLMDQLKPHWRRLAIALKFPQHEIDTMESKDDSVYYLLKEWLRGANKEKDSRPTSWRTLIEALRHANVQEEATVLEEKLILGLKAASHSEFSTVKSIVNRLNAKYTHHKRAVSSAGHGPESELSDPVKTVLPPPGKPHATNVTHNSITLQWSTSDRGASIVQYYTVFYRKSADNRDSWTAFQTYNARQNATLSDLDPKTAHVFKLRAEFSAGPSPDSELSDPIETLAEPWGVKIYKSLQPIPNSNPPTYQLPTHCVMQKGDIVKVHVGTNSQVKTRKGVHTGCSCHTRTAGVQHKILMLVGATGAGKRTLINGMANYILGVQWDDDFRFKLIAESTSQDQSKSQTVCITAYTFYKEKGSPLPYTLTVINIPGFGGTAEIDRDQKIVQQIKELFSFTGAEGIDELHGIGFVIQAPLAQLTPTQQYVFDAILSVFGRNVADNFFLMVTFADGMEPPVLDAVKAANLPYQEFFKFNNSALFANKSADDEFDSMFWKMGTRSFEEFFRQFSYAQPQNLQLSREVIQEREALEVTIHGLQPQIQAGLSKIDELRQERQMLKDHEADILKFTYKDFTYKVEVTKYKQHKTDLPPGTYTTNCLVCNYTCHDNCPYSDGDKYRCTAMSIGRGTGNATCGVCPGKCSWLMHKSNPYRFELYRDYETRALQELKTLYESAMSSKEQLEYVIKEMTKELDTLNMAVLRKIKQARRSVQRLQEIALKPNYLTEVEYIDLLIETEKREAKPRWLDRVQTLEGVRQQVEIVNELTKNPQQQYVFSIEETAQEKSTWQQFLRNIGVN